MYFPFREYSGTKAEFGPLANSEISASLRGLDDNFLTHIDLVSSGAGETALEDFVDALVGEVAVVCVEV